MEENKIETQETATQEEVKAETEASMGAILDAVKELTKQVAELVKKIEMIYDKTFKAGKF